MPQNPVAANYQGHHPAPAHDYAAHPPHLGSAQGSAGRYRGDRSSRNMPPPPQPWPTSPSTSAAVPEHLYGVYELGGGYYPPPPLGGHAPYGYGTGPPPHMPRYPPPPPAVSPPTTSNIPSPAAPPPVPPNLPSGLPPAPPPPPTISPPPPNVYSGVSDPYSRYPPPPHPYYAPPPHHPNEYRPPPPAADYAPHPHHPHRSQPPREHRDQEYHHRPPRDRNYTIPPPIPGDYPIPPPPQVPDYGISGRVAEYGAHHRPEYVPPLHPPPPIDIDYPPPPQIDPRDYRRDYPDDYRAPPDPSYAHLYNPPLDRDYLHPHHRRPVRAPSVPKSEYEMEYQSAPPSQGKLSRATSAVSGDGDGDGEYSSIPPPPKEIEYPSDVGSREREGKELEYHPRNPPPPISRAPSVKEVREIEYHPHGHPPPIPPPPALLPAGQKDNDYYDTTSEHPGIREIEYRPDTSYSHAKSRSRVGSELGPGGGQLYRPEAQQEPALVVRPPDPALITTPHWPPPREEAELDPRDAADLISNGTPLFRGKLREIVGAPRGYYSFYVCAGNEWDEETDCAPFQEATFGDMSSATTQGEALERPAMCHAFGRYPGSITLSCYTAGFSSQWRGVNDTTGAELSLKSTGGSRVKVRKLSMIHVVDRLRTLQDRGIEENDPVSLHDHIYNFLLYEPPRPGEGYSLETQISDLISALLRPSWIDFSVPENQVVSHFLRSTEPGVQNGFFHQLLLALELYLRIKISKLQKAIAAKVSWDLVLAQRWLENVEIQAPKVAKEGSSSVSFGFKNKESQREALKEFAWTLKWPNMHEVSYALSEEDDPAKVLEDRTVNCMSWFTGLILPGRSMPYIIMNALTDCDIDTPPNFRDIPSTAPNVGFQYRGHTYWHWECIVGKVLGAAKGVNQICGWLGPCISSPDLDRAEIAYINQIKPTNIIKLTAADVRNMQAASDPLGPESKTAYLTMDYDLIIPDREVVTDTIRIERLNFVPAKPVSEDELTVAGVAVPDSPMAASVVPSQSSVMQPPVPGGTASIGLGLSNVGLGSLSNGQKTTGPQPLPPPPPRPAQQPQRPIQTFDASITFAIRHRSWKVNLRYDTPFIAAYPCTGGPHVLYNKYYYHAVKVDSLVEIENWGPKAISAAAAAARRAKRIAREGGKRRRRRHGKRSRSCSERSGYRHHRHDSETESSVSDSASEDEDYDDHSDDEGESIARSDGSLDDRDHDYDDEDDDYDTLDSPPTPSSSFSPGKDDHLKLNNTLDEVLVVEAFGVHDNEVFARAWCSFWGVAAIMADLRRTCLACCVREAYAVGVSVVVLVDSGVGRRDDEVEEVDRKMEGLYT